MTRDEAIALCAPRIGVMPAAYILGVRHTLEALAAAGAFSDSPCTESNDANRGVHPALRAQFAKQMSDKLDAAGIK